MLVECGLQEGDLDAEWISRFSFDIVLSLNDDYPFMFLTNNYYPFI